MHTLDGVYVTLVVLMVVLMLLTFKMYMVQFQCFMKYSCSKYIYLQIQTYSFCFLLLQSVRKEHECENIGAVLHVQSLQK